MRSVANRIRDEKDHIIYEALKEAAPVYVEEGELFCLYAMKLCGLDKETIVKVHEEFERVVHRKELLGKPLKAEDLMESMERDYGMMFGKLDVNFPDFDQFVKEWRK